jgi:hypothetical protein
MRIVGTSGLTSPIADIMVIGKMIESKVSTMRVQKRKFLQNTKLQLGVQNSMCDELMLV